jgi:hypothetical protein
MDYKQKYLKYKQKYLNLKKQIGGKNKFKVGDIVKIVSDKNKIAKVTDVINDGLAYNLKGTNHPYIVYRNIAEQDLVKFKLNIEPTDFYNTEGNNFEYQKPINPSKQTDINNTEGNNFEYQKPINPSKQTDINNTEGIKSGEIIKLSDGRLKCNICGNISGTNHSYFTHSHNCKYY